MDNESPFVGGVDEEARLARLSAIESPGLRQRSAPNGLSSENDAPADEDPFDENTPLLSRFQTYPQRESESTAANDDEAIQQPWTGARELAGQPWYKEPSVSSSLRLRTAKRC